MTATCQYISPVRCQISAYYCSVLWAFNIGTKQALSSLWLFVKSASARYSENVRDFKAKKFLDKICVLRQELHNLETSVFFEDFSK